MHITAILTKIASILNERQYCSFARTDTYEALPDRKNCLFSRRMRFDSVKGIQNPFKPAETR